MSESIVISSTLAKRLRLLYTRVTPEEKRVEHPTWNEVISGILDYYAVD